MKRVGVLIRPGCVLIHVGVLMAKDLSISPGWWNLAGLAYRVGARIGA